MLMRYLTWVTALHWTEWQDNSEPKKKPFIDNVFQMCYLFVVLVRSLAGLTSRVAWAGEGGRACPSSQQSTVNTNLASLLLRSHSQSALSAASTAWYFSAAVKVQR